MNREKWFDKRFPAQQDDAEFNSLVEALASMPARLSQFAASWPATLTEKKPGGRWSLKEEVGHLGDLDALWLARVEDFRSGANALTPADLSNRGTDEAAHNHQSLDRLLARFAASRLAILDSVRSLPAEAMQVSLLHPRLQTPMRLIDHLAFVVAHDAHHWVTMEELVKELNGLPD